MSSSTLEPLPDGLIDEIFAQLPSRVSFTMVKNLLNLEKKENKAKGKKKQDSLIGLSNYIIPNITTIDFSESEEFTSNDVKLIIQNSFFNGLQKINLCGCMFGAYTIKSLLESPHLSNLTHLNLQHNLLDNDIVKFIAELPHLTKLEYLNLSANGIGHRIALQYLLLSPTISKTLVELDLSLTQESILLGDCLMELNDFDEDYCGEDNDYDDEYNNQLGFEFRGSVETGSKEMSIVEEHSFGYDLDDTVILSDKQIASLLQQNPLPFHKFSKLNLSLSLLRNGSIGEMFHRLPFFANLTSLSIADNPSLDKTAIASLATSPYLTNLTHLDINKLQLSGSDRLTPLFQSKIITKLTSLNLSDIALASIDLEHLSQSPNMSNLTELYIAGNWFDNAGVEALAKSPYTQKLQCLDMSRSAFLIVDFHGHTNYSCLSSLLLPHNVNESTMMSEPTKEGPNCLLFHLKKLDISSSELTDHCFSNLSDAWTALCTQYPDRSHHSEMEDLDLSSNNKLTHIGLEQFGSILTHCFINLNNLNLMACRIGDIGLKTLFQLDGLTQLDTIDLEGCLITGAGFDSLVQIPAAISKLSKLKTIYLYSNDLDDIDIGTIQSYVKGEIFL